MIKNESAKQYIENWNSKGIGSPVAFVQMLRSRNLTDINIADVLQAIDVTCNYCWNDSANCQCKKAE